MIMNGGQTRIWNEAIVACLKILYGNLPGETEKHKKPPFG
jgi:hypothetical protein